MRKILVATLFLAIAGLCGYELVGRIQETAQRDDASVRYSVGLDAPAEKKATPRTFDVNEILEKSSIPHGDGY